MGVARFGLDAVCRLLDIRKYGLWVDRGGVRSSGSLALKEADKNADCIQYDNGKEKVGSGQTRDRRANHGNRSSAWMWASHSLNYSFLPSTTSRGLHVPLHALQQWQLAGQRTCPATAALSGVQQPGGTLRPEYNIPWSSRPIARGTAVAVSGGSRGQRACPATAALSGVQQPGGTLRPEYNIPWCSRPFAHGTAVAVSGATSVFRHRGTVRSTAAWQDVKAQSTTSRGLHVPLHAVQQWQLAGAVCVSRHRGTVRSTAAWRDIKQL
ncbi:hypothetical protein J6590_055738 [Homalodisca vitripennis]|nr:hypothetical protein J6590_055738 [Homalodisca vitripennis]